LTQDASQAADSAVAALMAAGSAAGRGGGAPLGPLETADYYASTQAELAALMTSPGVATLSGKTVALYPGDYDWVDATWASRNFTSETIFISAYPLNRANHARFTYYGGGRTFSAPKNVTFRKLRHYMPFVPGVDSNAAGCLLLGGVTEGLKYDQCEIYGNLLALVQADGYPDNMGDWGWRGFFGSDGASSLSGEGLKITDCTLHSFRRGLNIRGGATGKLEIIGNEFYNFGVDGFVISGPQTGLKLNWNVMHSPLSGWSGNDIAGTFDPVTDVFTSAAPHGLSGTETMNISPNTGAVPGGLSLLDDYVVTSFPTATTMQWPVNVTSAGTDVRVYREPSHADFMQAVPGANDWTNFQVIGNVFIAKRTDAIESYEDAQVVFFEDINTANTDANHYTGGVVAGNMIWSATNNGILIYNPINCIIQNNTLISDETLSGRINVGFYRHEATGTGSGNHATLNIGQLFSSVFGGDRALNNIRAGYLGTDYGELFVSPASPPTTRAAMLSNWAILSGSVADLWEPKLGAAGTGYFDYNARTYSLPTRPTYDLHTLTVTPGSTRVDIVVTTTSGTGTLYYMVDAGVRTKAQVIAQGTAAGKGTQAVAGTGVQATKQITGLSASTAYKVYVVQVNGSAAESQMLAALTTTSAGSGFAKVDSNGTGYLTRAGGFVSPSNNKTATFAIKGKLLAGDGSVIAMVRQNTSSQPIQIDRQSVNSIRMSFRNAGGTVIGRADTATSINVALGEFVAVGSIDLATAAVHFYVNGSSSRSGTDLLTNDTINWSAATTLSALASPTGTGLADMEVEYIYLTNSYLDLSVPATLAKFDTLTGMANDGSGPTGSSPLLFLRGAAAAWNGGTANNGTGGAFTAASATFTDV
jgi:hypothetical protein